MSEPTSPPTPRGQLSLEVRDCEVEEMVATPATRASLHASKTSQPSGLRHVISSSPVEDSKSDPELLKSPPGFPATNSTSFKAPRMTQNFHTRSPSDMQSPVTQAIMKRRQHTDEGRPRRFEDLGSASGISPIMKSQISPIKSRSLGRKNTPPSLPHPPPPAARRGAPSSPVDGMMSPATMFVEHAHEHDENHQHFAPEHFTSDSPPAAKKKRSGRRFSFEADDVMNSPHTSARRAQELAGSRLSGGSTDGGSSVGDSDADAKTYDEYDDEGEGSGRSYNTESKAESPERSATPRAEARAREWATRTPDEKKNDVARMFLRRKRLGATGARAAEARMREVRSPSDSLMSPVSKQLAMRPGAGAARNHVVRLGPPPESSYANPMPRTAPGSPGVLTPRSGALLRAAKASSSRRNNERKPKALDLRQGGGSNEWARGLQSPSDSLMSPVSKRIEARHTELQKKTSLSDDQLKGLLRGAIDAVSPSSKRALKNASRRRRMMDLSLHPDSPAGAPTPPGAFQSPPRSSSVSSPEPPSPTPTPRRKLRMDTESKIESGLLSPMSQRAVQSKPRRRMMRQLQPPASPSATIPAVGRRGSGPGAVDLHSPPDPRGLAKAMLSRTKPKPGFSGDGRRRSASAVVAPNLRMTHSPSDALTSPASRAVARVRAGSIPPSSSARRRLLSEDIPPPLEQYGRSVSSPVPGLPPPAYVPRNNSK